MENKKKIIFREDLVKREEILYLKFTDVNHRRISISK